MGDLIPFRKRKRSRWTSAEDYGVVLPTRRWQGRVAGGIGLGTLRPWILLVVLVACWKALGIETLEPLPGFSSDPERVEGSFTRCGPGRGTFCVVDGDTFKLGERMVRVLGIDAPEVHPARCPAEAERGEAATAALQGLLNQGAFRMTGRINDMTDKYGRDLRSVQRTRADGTVQSIAEDLLASGAVRRYLGGSREPWC
jgi:micrococcal nuclease